MSELPELSAAALAELRPLVASAGYDMEDLLSRAAGVCIYGSRAAGCHRPDSDWDVLVLGMPGPWRVRRPGIDLSFEDPAAPGWLGRELAIHVTGYSAWISGSMPWRPEDLDWEVAEAFKLRKVRSRADAVRRVGPGTRQLEKLRNDLRRLEHLRRREYVPPAALLTPDWDRSLFPDLEPILSGA